MFLMLKLVKKDLPQCRSLLIILGIGMIQVWLWLFTSLRFVLEAEGQAVLAAAFN